MTSPLSEFDMELDRGPVRLYLSVRASVGQSFKGSLLDQPHGAEVEIREAIVYEAVNDAGDVVEPSKGTKLTLTPEEEKRLEDEIAKRVELADYWASLDP